MDMPPKVIQGPTEIGTQKVSPRKLETGAKDIKRRG